MDDIVIKDGFCPKLKECEFEDVNMCGWTNEKRYAYYQNKVIYNHVYLILVITSALVCGITVQVSFTSHILGHLDVAFGVG